MQQHHDNNVFQPEIWAGAECSINRVGDAWFNQVKRTGHFERAEDIELLAELKINKIRFPILWEQFAPENLYAIDWSWADVRLEKLKKYNIEPVAGLLHHGCGPVYTDLSDKKFPQKFAAYTRLVAKKYPWIKYYTPVNEPLTTARFSGLYGLWFPHKKNDADFLRMLFNQVKGIILAMQEVKKINPQAQLIQTEDLGKTHSTKKLNYQAQFENERRWLTYDLLTCKVNKEHPLWNYFMWSGIKEKELHFFLNHDVRPSVLGFNYYITSERYIDENLEKYPAQTHGGNLKHAYADVEAVRKGKNAGPYLLLKEAWEKYAIPPALTEIHLSSCREEQLRWIKYIWSEGKKLHKENIPLHAITFWSAFGAYDWHNLITKKEDKYESGIFDVRNKIPRKTVLTEMIQSLSSQTKYEHPVAADSGWWMRRERIIYPVALTAVKKLKQIPAKSAPVLITGATGTLGNAFAQICNTRGIHYKVLSRKEMDIADKKSVENAILFFKPWAIINTAGYVKVDDAENDTERCFRENTLGPYILSSFTAENKIKLLTFSTDLVFNGHHDKPYLECDKAEPLNVYGKSKLRAEEAVLKNDANALVIRSSAFFGPWDMSNFIARLLQASLKKELFTAANDIYISPTYIPDLVNAALDLLIDNEKGVWHLANDGNVTWAHFAQMACNTFSIPQNHICYKPKAEINFVAKRPSFSVLSSEKSTVMPPLDDALFRYAKEIAVSMN